MRVERCKTIGLRAVQQLHGAAVRVAERGASGHDELHGGRRLACARRRQDEQQC
jgi:hypothetical protein